MASETPVDYRKCYRTYGLALNLGLLLLCWNAYIWAGFTAVVLIGMAVVAVGQVAHRVNNPALAQRADEQNAAVERGDMRGIYGEYPPAKIPPPPTVRKLLKDWEWGVVDGKRVMVIRRHT